MIIYNFDINIIWAILIFFTGFMIIYNSIISLGEQHLPLGVLELFKYGKTLNGPVRNPFVKLISVPKTYFTHFYIFSSIYVPSLLLLVLYYYTNQTQVDGNIHSTLDFVCSERRSAGTTPSHLVLALSLLSLQVFRRLYECAFINQSSDSTMNITHYIVGYAHYFCTATGFLCEAPGFVAAANSVSTSEMSVSFFSVSWQAWAGTLVFLAAWHQQLQAHKIFAQLKLKNSNKHSIPEGGLFKYVSCPHYLCEIIIYTSLLLVLGTQHQTAVLVWFWVLTNQLIAGTMSHKWYKEKFREEYPPARKAVLPAIW